MGGEDIPVVWKSQDHGMTSNSLGANSHTRLTRPCYKIITVIYYAFERDISSIIRANGIASTRKLLKTNKKTRTLKPFVQCILSTRSLGSSGQPQEHDSPMSPRYPTPKGFLRHRSVMRAYQVVNSTEYRSISQVYPLWLVVGHLS